MDGIVDGQANECVYMHVCEHMCAYETFQLSVILTSCINVAPITSNRGSLKSNKYVLQETLEKNHLIDCNDVCSLFLSHTHIYTCNMQKYISLLMIS